MVHMVIHPAGDGTVEYHPFEDLDSAVSYVERQRNAGVDEARLYELHEIPLTVRSYFKVEVGAPEAADSSVDATAQAEAQVVEAAEQIVEGVSSDTSSAFEVPETREVTNGSVTSSNGDEPRRGLFGR